MNTTMIHYLVSHPQVNPNDPLVCDNCKLDRWVDALFRRRSFWFGACANCQADNADPAFPMTCLCQPSGTWSITSARSGQSRERHLCRAHDLAFWNARLPATQQEIDIRLSMKRRKLPQLSHHAKKRRTPLAQLTPLQRRTRMRWIGLPRSRVVPSCFCGAKLTVADHARPNFGQTHVRSCVSCLEFVLAQAYDSKGPSILPLGRE